MNSNHLLQSLLEMPSVERAEVVSVLIDSLDADLDDDSSIIAEALRRDQSVEEGSAYYVEEAEFRQSINRK